MYQFINEYDICNVAGFFYKAMDLKLYFFDAALIVKKLPLIPKKKLTAINNCIARLKLKTKQL